MVQQNKQRGVLDRNHVLVWTLECQITVSRIISRDERGTTPNGMDTLRGLISPGVPKNCSHCHQRTVGFRGTHSDSQSLARLGRGPHIVSSDSTNDFITIPLRSI